MTLTTELRWDGKYDAKGNRVMPLRVKLPFQDVETVNESTLSRRTLFRARPTPSPGATDSSGATRSTSCPRCSTSSPAR